MPSHLISNQPTEAGSNVVFKINKRKDITSQITQIEKTLVKNAIIK